MTEVYKLDEIMEKWKTEFEKPDKGEHMDGDGLLDRLGMHQAGHEAQAKAKGRKEQILKN